MDGQHSRIHNTSNFICVECRICFDDLASLHHHVKDVHKGKKTFRCEFCPKIFKRFKLYDKHKNINHRCPVCLYQTGNVIALSNHIRTHNNSTPVNLSGEGISVAKSYNPFKKVEAFRGFLRVYKHRINNSEHGEISAQDYYKKYESTFRNIVETSIHELRHIKIQLSLLVQFERGTQMDEGMYESCEQYINSHLRVCLNMFYFETIMQDSLVDINHIIEIFTENGSGWTMSKILGSDVKIAGFSPLKGGNFVRLPDQIRNKKATIAVHNKDDNCFKWAFLSILHYNDINSKHRERVSSYRPFEGLYNFSKLQSSSSLKDITKFEKDNHDKNFSINVFSVLKDYYGTYVIEVDYISPNVSDESKRIVNLLYYKEDEKHLGHYYGVVDIGKLLGRRNMHKHFLCYNCLNFFTTQDKLYIHQQLCEQFRPQKVIIPCEISGKPPTICFENSKHKLKVGFVIYADFEALLITSNKKLSNNVESFQRHSPCGFSLVVVDDEGTLVQKEVFRGKNCIDEFISRIILISRHLLRIYRQPKPMLDLTEKEQNDYNNAQECFICLRPIKQAQKVRDHSHLSGRYRGCAHQHCNLNYKQRKKIPVVMHNFRGYDSHLLISGLRLCTGEISVVPTNSEKFMSIICVDFLFLDSMMFLNASLDTLVSNLKGGCTSDGFVETFSLLVQGLGLEKAKMLSRKGVYPYEYFSDWNKFGDTIFPDRKEFFSSLTDSLVSQKDYEYGKKVFSMYCSTLGDYHDLYLLTDTLLLATVFENFRNVAIFHNKLDPLYYFSLAGYAWDIALYRSKAEIEMITDLNAYNFIETAIRGGIAMISTREANANNKYMHDFNKNEESSFIAFWDKNNLYGEALQSYLPVGDFKWMSARNLRNVNRKSILAMKDDDIKGGIFEVDLEYGEELHMSHSDYPLCPEKLAVTEKQLSPYQKSLLAQLKMNYNEKQQKLVPHLGDRKNYVTHYRNLKFYLSQGLKLKKVHRCLEFRQEPWLKDYVNFCTSMRQKSKSAFEKDYWKFLVNSVFGKSMERVRDRMDVRIVQNREYAEQFTSLNRMKSFRLFPHCGSLAIITLTRMRVVLDRPIYTAFTVLELSKLFMYDFHYNHVKSWYGNNAHLLMTDTDSLSYLIYTNDLYDDMKKRSYLFDFSDYPLSHELYSSVNKKVIGKMKDEANGEVLENFVGLAPKMYSFLSKRMNKKTAKGVKKSIVKKRVRHWLYRDVLRKQYKVFCKMNLIRSQFHELRTVNIKKTALHCFDSKRYIKSDGRYTLAHNHFLTK